MSSHGTAPLQHRQRRRPRGGAQPVRVWACGWARVWALVLGGVLSVSGAPVPTAAAASNDPAHAFDLQGHRGARGLAPENTLAGFRVALSVGVHTLELDLAMTADDIPVVTHDLRLHPDLVRQADGRWVAPDGPAVRELTREQLAAYDVGRLRPGSPTAQRFAAQRPVDGERIPTLAQVLALAQPHEGVRLNIETKINPLQPDLSSSPERFVLAVVQALDEAGLRGRASLQSFDWRTLMAAREQAPDIPRVALTARQSWLDNVADPRWTAGLRLADHRSVPDLVHAAGMQVWSPFHGDLTPRDLQRARELGLPVVVWTVNEPADLERALDLGVDGIISDYPDRVRTALLARGRPVPAPVMP